ncbi:MULTISPECIES: DUF1127 domain-containing protein [unclassified Mesorhizobium]|uniref:DUF1127 domain-containing protein n=1 Tax=unclassified Mesorhizobium TaxID=325217 RepID=UPI000FCBFCC9|nr:MULTISPECIES: DUF1127 domain-containing protein [unclassified Mesorhizobium]TGR48707.1 DUF1127 domain-containing protein [bacterium M00.F.Ca.ET.199.01.1.1]TGU37748.1 DUF1127 domain-containing protein [bacterium M00.F.Ca.ET.156.01.1.1]TGU96866.1 DUF1127 domain-containing protein [Mesorhizobium sp. M00.F.Ca.ET.151.01.1.1]TGV57985.1 DUF1127 domain-containing protein [bacterium M00.F.Ca.ET.141.01.1.1]TGV88835.1 DUF1127 domain-containing protein [Mesorhizobium sp. M00.F.Ca.ET.149.01.1.1]
MRPDHTTVHGLAGRAPAVRAATTKQSLRAHCIAAARWFGRQMEKRRSRLALLEMSDEQLKDIGLSRGQAYAEFRRR